MKHDDAAVGRRGFLARIGALVGVAVAAPAALARNSDPPRERVVRYICAELDGELEPTMWSRGIDEPEVIIPLRRDRNGRLGVLTSRAKGPTR